MSAATEVKYAMLCGHEPLSCFVYSAATLAKANPISEVRQTLLISPHLWQVTLAGPAGLQHMLQAMTRTKPLIDGTKPP